MNRDEFKANRLRRGRASMSGQAYVLTACTERRQPVFVGLRLPRIAVHHFRRLDEAAQTLAFVVMPDHVHWLVQLGSGRSLSQLMRQFKGASARDVNRARMAAGRLWQPGFHDRALTDDVSLEVAASYIVENPVRAELVSSVWDYPHWDTKWVRRCPEPERTPP